MRFIRATFPKVLGYTPEFSPTESIFALPVIERLNEWDDEGILIPVLAESWEGDPENLTITWHLRKGVTFHDGTDWNAEALRWNYQLGLDTGRLTDGQYVDSLEVIDDYTLTMHLTSFNWHMYENYGWAMMVSPTAFRNSGATDEERIEWARMNSVGTGPFTVTDFQRDTFIRYERNDNYWREGMPYLDAIEVRLIPDVMTAAAMIEAGEADCWTDVSDVQMVLDLEEKGFNVNWALGFFNALLPNSADPDSPLSDQRVRAAIEYAIDRESLAEMIGYGHYEALHQMASIDWPGYVEGYNPRPYNPDMARELLADAGYPNGFKTSIMITDRGAARDTAAALKAYLAEVGIDADIDIADLGRYFGAVFATGWDDLVFAASGINPDATDLFVHFGPSPMTYRTGNIAKSQEFLDKCEAALDPSFEDAFEAMDKIKEAIRQGGEDAMIIPVYRSAQAQVMQPYVHSDYCSMHTVIWTSYDDWMEQP